MTDLIDRGSDLARRRLDPGAVANLRASLRGTVVGPEDPAYDATRQIWNAAIDRRPALIARCVGAEDVVAALGFGQREGLPISIRGGGHNVAGTSVVDDGLMIDLSPMRRVEVDSDRMEVSVEPGVLLGELDAATQVHGLAVPIGIATETGVAGLTLGGGIGWLMRRHGLTCDNLIEATLVTAEGETIRASETERPELLWGLRGGGGNFGIVTEFRFKAYRVGPAVTAGGVSFALEGAVDVLRRYRDWAAEIPDEMTTILALRTLLPLPSIPEALHGRRVLMISMCHLGNPVDAARAVAAVRSFGQPILDTIAAKPLVVHQASLDASVPRGKGYYWKSEFLAALDDPTIDTLVEHAAAAPQPWSYVIVFQQGGAMARIDDSSAAYVGRHAPYAVNINGVWERPAEQEGSVAWTRATWEALRPHSAGAVYVNFLGEEGPDRVLEAYGRERFARLQALKDVYDPENVFRMNQNIPPSRG